MRILRNFVGGIGRVVHQDLLGNDQRVHRMAEAFHVKLPAGRGELHQVQRGKVAGRIIQEHVFRTRIRRIDPRRALAGMPAVYGGIELHAGVAALPGGLGNVTHHFPGRMAVFLLSIGQRSRPPFTVFRHRFHEVIGDAHGVVGVLKEDGTVGIAIQRGIVAGCDQSMRFLFFFGLAPNEFADIGVIHIEDHHLGRAAGLAAGFDHARKGVEALHERKRAGRTSASGKNRVFLAQGREIGTGARAPLEQHAFGLGKVKNRFQGIFYRHDEAGRTLRFRFIGELLDTVPVGFIKPAVAA